jgi:DNA-binding protein H-NS
MSHRRVARPESKVDAAITAKIGEQRHELEAQLSKLEGYDGRGRRGRPAGRGAPRGAVAPKYRNPDNPTETWAGRGPKPRWLAAALKGGKRFEYFAIGGTAKASAVRQPKKTRKAKK